MGRWIKALRLPPGQGAKLFLPSIFAAAGDDEPDDEPEAA
jgi:hypothetical protein